MGKDNKHKIEAKFRNGLIDYEDVPIEVKKKWDRINFDKGEQRKNRNIKKSKDKDGI